jgi:hypothetical protein
MTILPPEVVVALSLGLPTLAFAILTWWETRRRVGQARGSGFLLEPTHHLLIQSLYFQTWNIHCLRCHCFHMQICKHVRLFLLLQHSRICLKETRQKRGLSTVYTLHTSRTMKMRKQRAIREEVHDTILMYPVSHQCRSAYAPAVLMRMTSRFGKRSVLLDQRSLSPV